MYYILILIKRKAPERCSVYEIKFASDHVWDN
jgi:hypothetical protein